MEHVNLLFSLCVPFQTLFIHFSPYHSFIFASTPPFHSYSLFRSYLPPPLLLPVPYTYYIQPRRRRCISSHHNSSSHSVAALFAVQFANVCIEVNSHTLYASGTCSLRKIRLNFDCIYFTPTNHPELPLQKRIATIILKDLQCHWNVGHIPTKSDIRKQ